MGLVLVGAVEPLRALFIVPTQLVAAIAAAAVTDGLIPGPLQVANTLGGGASIAQGLFLEMFLTAQLVLTVYFLAVEKHRGTYLAPIGIGISVFVCHIVATNWTGTSINPARSFGPAVIIGFVGYHWIYWLGPLMGAVLAWLVYTLFKYLEFEGANPGQDDDDLERGEKIIKVADEQVLAQGPPRADTENSEAPVMNGRHETNGRNDLDGREKMNERKPRDSVLDGQMSHA